MYQKERQSNVSAIVYVGILSIRESREVPTVTCALQQKKKGITKEERVTAKDHTVEDTARDTKQKEIVWYINGTLV